MIWAAREITKRNQNVDEFFSNGLIIVILSGYIFARLTYVLLEVFGGRGDQFQSFLDVINIRPAASISWAASSARLSWAGFYIRRRRLNFWHHADVAGPALLIAQGIGRWGQLHQSGTLRPPTTRPWGYPHRSSYRLPQYSDLTQFPWTHDSTPRSCTNLSGSFLIRRAGVSTTNFSRQVAAGNALRRVPDLVGVLRVHRIFRSDQPTVGSSAITYLFLMAFWSGIDRRVDRLVAQQQCSAGSPPPPTSSSPNRAAKDNARPVDAGRENRMKFAARTSASWPRHRRRIAGARLPQVLPAEVNCARA